MGQILSNFIACVCAEADEEEERPNEQSLLISPPIYDSCSNSSLGSRTCGMVFDSTIQVVDLSTRQLIKEDQAKEEDNEEEEEEEEEEEDDQAKEENNEEDDQAKEENSQAEEENNKSEEKLIITNEVMMKQRRIQKCSSTHSINQAVEDSMQVSFPFLDLNTREPREAGKAKEEEKLIISKEKDKREEEELTISNQVVMKERWIQYYGSSHKILLVGEGDFSFSASLARAFGSATNMVATSLDSKGFLRRNYKKAMSNVDQLRSRGCNVMHGVNATQVANHGSLKGMKFDRIIFNFPLAGFFRNESRESQLCRNQTLILLFLENAKKMISEEGEIHIAHKSWGFFLQWDLKHLASAVGLQFKEELPFNLKDYNGYHTKYGFGGDRNFDCQPSKTYKFGLIEHRKMIVGSLCCN